MADGIGRRAHGHTRGKRGNSGRSLTYNSWRGMISRCTLKTDVAFKYYGGKGVSVCDAWLSFAGFLQDMVERPSREYSIERVDVDGDYCPENCTWATRAAQARNNSKNHLLTAFGKTLCVAAWAEELGCKPSLIYNRIYRGWPPERSVSL